MVGYILKHATERQLTYAQHAGQTVVMRDVKEKMKELNVQLDNLCQVLNCQAKLHASQSGAVVLHVCF